VRASKFFLVEISLGVAISLLAIFVLIVGSQDLNYQDARKRGCCLSVSYGSAGTLIDDPFHSHPLEGPG